MSSFFERHVGIVTSNDDPEKRGRIRVACAAIMGVDDNGDPVEYPRWLQPRYPIVFSSDGKAGTGGAFWVPDKGVAVEFEITAASKYDQSRGQSSITNPDPRWLGCVVGPEDKNPVTINTDALEHVFEKNYPLRRGVTSANGHALVFDDSEQGTDQGDVVILLHRSGHVIRIASDMISMSLNDESVELELNSDGTANIKASTLIKLECGSVELGRAATEAVIKGNTFQALFNAHTHNGNLGAPTGPPLVPLNGSELSQVSSTE